MSFRDPLEERPPAEAVIMEGSETVRPAQPRPAPAARGARNVPTPSFAVFVLIASLASGLAGGVVATALQQRLAEEPAPSPAALERSVDLTAPEIVAAADAVVPAVVTIVNRSGGNVGTGSGVVIDKTNGYIVTNSHVIEQLRTTRPSGSITVLLSDGRFEDATVIGNDPRTDVAVLQVPGPLPAEATLAERVPLPVGSAVIAIGTPGTGEPTVANALVNTVTSGIVSATGRRMPRMDVQDVILTDLIQTDASIGPGMSGGPLVLVSSRQVVGLTTLLVRGDANLGFAIPSETVVRIAQELITRAGGGS